MHFGIQLTAYALFICTLAEQLF